MILFSLPLFPTLRRKYWIILCVLLAFITQKYGKLAALFC